MTHNTTSPRRSLVRGALAAAALGGGLLLTGCVVAPVGPAYADAAVVAPYAPPPPQYEVMGVAPSPVSVWVGGYWGWGGGRYNWHPGHWGTPPRPGYAWHPHTWSQGRGGWVHGGGRWGPR
ncbi:MAG: hypothetical protein QM740_09410 [Acidovorax sp.]